MSETEAAVATAPTEAPTGESNPAPIQDGAAAALTPETQAPLSRREAKLSLREMNRQRTEAAPEAAPEPQAEAVLTEPVVDSQGRKHDPATGKFIGENDTAAAEGPQGDGGADAPAAETPPTVRLELPEALREQGRDHWEVPAEQERFARTLINGYVRRQEAESARQEVQRLQLEIARRDAQQGAQSEWHQSPEYREAVRVRDAIGEVNPDVAEAYWKGMEAKFSERVQPRIQEAEQQVAVQRQIEVAEAFDQQVVATLPNLPSMAPGLFAAEWMGTPGDMQARQLASQTYMAELNASRDPRTGEIPPFDLQRFVLHYSTHAERDPWLKQYRDQRANEKDAAAREAAATEAEKRVLAQKAEAEKARLLDAGRRNADRNPVANIASHVRSDKLSTQHEAPDLSSLSGADLKRHLKGEARQTARSLFTR